MACLACWESKVRGLTLAKVRTQRYIDNGFIHGGNVTRCHIPTLHQYDIFPPGGSMTGGKMLVGHDNDDVGVH